MLNTRKFAFTALLAGLVLIGAVPAALAEHGNIVPPGLDPGAVLSHYVQDIQRRQREPWLYRPIRPSDYRVVPPDEPLIEYSESTLQGNIVLPAESPAVRIKPVLN